MPKGMYLYKYRVKEPTISRFLAKIIVRDNGCWEWRGCKTDGYGRLWDGNRLAQAHRFAYEYFNNEIIPLDRQPDHLCRNRACVNPRHLELVTCRENIMRGIGFAAQNARKTYCSKGHPYDKTNTYRRPSGSRNCRKCDTERMRERRAKLQEV